ncbi:MAG: type VI secretion system tip protein VgrG, partial [Pseudomonadota bacterium]|nr:type VI secretion system tip protein VgrG [Pseudomonadota bacterium]
SGRKIVIDAGTEITLKAGGSFIKIDPSGVSVSGPSIRVNTGGSPGLGTAAALILPGGVVEADAATAGQPLEALVKQRRVFLQALSGLCEVCEAAQANGAKHEQ